MNTYAREGDPADAILDVAEERGADLIVVGNKGMTGAKRFLLGSVPEQGLPPRALLGADHPDDLSRRPRRIGRASGVAAGVDQPAPYALVLARHAGSRAVALRRSSTACGVGSGPRMPEAMTSAAAAATWGAAIEVPM